MSTDTIETLRCKVGDHFLGVWGVEDFSYEGLSSLSARLQKEYTAHWRDQDILLKRHRNPNIMGKRFSVIGEDAAQRLAYLEKRVAGMVHVLTAEEAKHVAVKKAWQERLEASAPAAVEAPAPVPKPACEADELRAALASGVIHPPEGLTEEEAEKWSYTYIALVARSLRLLVQEQEWRDSDADLVARLYMIEMMGGAVWTDDEMRVADRIMLLNRHQETMTARLAYLRACTQAFNDAKP